MVLTSAAARLPRSPGVYRFRAGTRVLYVGRATDLRSRVRSYAGDLADRPHLRRMVAQVSAVEAIECASVHEASWLERTLLEQSLPRWNRVRGGAEVACWLVVDDTPRTAGLRLTRSPTSGGRRFGPYLGTDRAALLLAGLRRVAPLDLTRFPLGASEAELARLSGVGPDDRQRLAAHVAGVLARDPDQLSSATAALTDRRDRSAAACGYELAARITAELDALAWAGAPQRVAGDLPDADLAAYDDGLLIRLRVRQGRLGAWRCDPVGATTAARYVAGSPEVWREFAEAAARLAVRLREPGQSGRRARRAPPPSVCGSAVSGLRTRRRAPG